MAQEVIRHGYKKTGFGVIPKNWTIRRLGELVEIKNGISPSKLKLNKQGPYPYLKVEDLNNCTKYQGTSRFYTENSDSLIPKFSLIFPKRGAAILNNKVRINLKKVQIDTNLMAINPLDGEANGEYLFYKIVFEKLYRIADTSSIPQINIKHIAPYRITVPPLPEQKAIADCLSTWDKAIEKQTQLITAKKLFKKGLMQEFFNGKLTIENGELIKAKEGEDFTKDWEEVELEEIFSFIPNATYSREDETPNGEIQHIHYGDIHTKFIYNIAITDQNLPKLSFSKLKDYQPIKVGDLILADTSEDYEGVGKAVEVIRVSDKVVIAGLHTHHLRKKDSRFYLGFKGYLFYSDFIKHQFHKLATGTKVYSLSKSSLSKVLLRIPPVLTQKNISKILQSTDKEIKLQEKKLAQLQLQKKGLMQVLLTGKKRLIN